MKFPSLTFDNIVILFGIVCAVGGVVLKLWLGSPAYIGVTVLGCIILILGLANYNGGELV